MSTLNLDKLAAERAQAVVADVQAGIPGVRKPVETLERLATKTLGVLQAQGIYAMLLFLFSRSSDEEKVAPLIRGQLFEALKALPGFQGNNKIRALSEATEAQQALKVYSDHVLDNLDTLLLVRDLYEQTLIYTRFGAKAAKAAVETQEESTGAEA
ncbi:MAG: hypothetical protein KatS3mg131_1998 [Candidatus Tectimicrobiota bacterium]|nr:MAG: hypothetical protein KatS3mg131_1998 [Candidatus Tectomicrobia bacterium]